MKTLMRIPEQLYVFLGFLIFYLCTLASNFSGSHDSIGYLNGMVEGKSLFHQHHLLYHFITHYWLQTTSAVFPAIPDYYLAEAFTALWGSGSLALVYSFFRNRFGLAIPLSVLCTSVAGFSYGMWLYSVNVEVYALPIFILLATLYLLTGPDFSRRLIIQVALLQSAAILFHQLHVLFSVTMLYMLWQQRSKVPFRTSLSIYAGIGLVLVGGAYFVVGWLVEEQNSVSSWMAWLQGYAGGNEYWQPVGPKTPLYVATGLSHAFIGGHFVFRLPNMPEYLDRVTGGHSLTDELFLVRNMSGGMAVFLLILTLLLGLLMILLIVRFIRKYRSVKRSQRPVMVPLLVTVITYSIFFCFWEPEILEFWVFQTVLFWMLVLGTWARENGSLLRMRPIMAVALISISLFLVNFFGSIRYFQDLENDLYYLRTLPIKNTATEADAVLLQDGWILKDFLDYYTPAQIWEVPSADSQRVSLDARISTHLNQGGRLFIYPESRNALIEGDTRYIDSLRSVHPEKITILHAGNPKIFVIR